MIDECNKTIGCRIAIARNRADESQGDLANAIGVKREMVTYWENGTRAIKAETVVAIANRYGVSADYLLGLSDSPTRVGDKQKAEEYTGLSAEAIDMLHKVRVCYGDIVSSLIESPHFKDYIYSLERLENRISSCQLDINTVHENGISDGCPVTSEMMGDPDFMDLFKKKETGSYAVSHLYTELALLQVSLFELSRIHSSIIESVFPNEKTISDGREILKSCGIDL